MKLLVTGGAGFIGSAFVRYVLANRPDLHVLTFDALTYAGNLENLEEVKDHPRHEFMHADIRDEARVAAAFATGIDAVVHFAAESHVDRSILSPDPVIETNVRGTARLLDAARAARVARFVHVSTDEVYGDIEEPLEADETFPLKPSSPYAASKASSDLLALAYVRTYGLPVVITRASNNYGPYQFPEKLIPLMISNALEGAPLPIYGDGQQVRDWLYVDDHCRAILAVLERGRTGEVYNVGRRVSPPEPRGGEAGASDRRGAGEPDDPRHRSAGPRSALRAAWGQDRAGHGLRPGGRVRGRARPHRAVVPGAWGLDGAGALRRLSRLLRAELRLAQQHHRALIASPLDAYISAAPSGAASAGRARTGAASRPATESRAADRPTGLPTPAPAHTRRTSCRSPAPRA